MSEDDALQPNRRPSVQLRPAPPLAELVLPKSRSAANLTSAPSLAIASPRSRSSHDISSVGAESDQVGRYAATFFEYRPSSTPLMPALIDLLVFPKSYQNTSMAWELLAFAAYGKRLQRERVS